MRCMGDAMDTTRSLSTSPWASFLLKTGNTVFWDQKTEFPFKIIRNGLRIKGNAQWPKGGDMGRQWARHDVPAVVTPSGKIRMG